MTNDQQIRLENILVEAEEVFWKTIARAFPEAKSGDFPPDADKKFMDAIGEATVLWIEINCN